MQNQSYSSLPRTLSNITLDMEFPCGVSGLHHHKDDPITHLHAHNYLEIGCCYEGTGIFVVENKVMPFASGDICVIPGSLMHLARSTVGTISLWTWMYLDPIRLVTLPPRDQPVLDPMPLSRPDFINIIKPATDAMVGEIVRQMIDEIHREIPQYKTAVRGLACTLMARLHRLILQADAETPVIDRRDSLHRIGRALDYLAGHYTETIRVDDLADRCRVSVPTLRRLFRKALGRAPLEYLLRLRIQMASSLLAGTDRPILNIAFDVGFETLSSFNRHFKRQTGLSPREWRKRGRIPEGS
jgi:AraC-like DNA-binding protein